jgi:hypothetical protein
MPSRQRLSHGSPGVTRKRATALGTDAKGHRGRADVPATCAWSQSERMDRGILQVTQPRSELKASSGATLGFRRLVVAGGKESPVGPDG